MERIELPDVIGEFITNKTDKFENDVSYFKLHSALKNKTLQKPGELRIPVFKGDNQNEILKVKKRFLPDYPLREMTKYKLEIEFIPYDYQVSQDENIQGYYARVLNIKDYKK